MKPQVQRPTCKSVGASWVALLVGARTFLFKLPSNTLDATVRVYVWIVLVACYGLGIQATVFALAGDGAKFISPYNLLAVLIGVPTLVGYAGSLWSRNAITTPLRRLEVTLCAGYPALVLLVGGTFVLARTGA